MSKPVSVSITLGLLCFCSMIQAQVPDDSVGTKQLKDLAVTSTKIFPGAVSGDLWSATSSSPIAARIGHTAVWTGTEVIIWGGVDGSGNPLNDGARYNPTLDRWTLIPSLNAPAARSGHTAVWTGTEMVVWGGSNGNVIPVQTSSPMSALDSGGRFDPVVNRWNTTAMPATGSSRLLHTAVWTGTEMIIWGGVKEVTGPLISPTPLNIGARFNPSTNSWKATSILGKVPTPRSGHTAVWTGSEMIVWGGGLSLSGSRFTPGTDTWTEITVTGAPAPRSGHTAVWTGTEMIIWGGLTPANNTGAIDGRAGGRYNPVGNTWTAMSTIGVPGLSAGHTAVWTGSEMIVWGDGSNQSSNVGGRYNVSADAWIGVSSDGVVSRRAFHVAAWTGSQMLIWGGETGFFAPRLANGGRYKIGNILASSIGSMQLSAGSVGTAQLGDNAVTDSKIMGPLKINVVIGTALTGNSTEFGSGVLGLAANGIGVSGTGTDKGVYGLTATAGSTHAGVFGENTAAGGRGVVGQGPIGIEARTSLATGVAGLFHSEGGGDLIQGEIKFGPAGILNLFRVDATGIVFAKGQVTNGNVSVTGNATISGSADIKGSQVVTGNATIGGNLSVVGDESFGAQTRQMINLFQIAYGIGVQKSALYQRTGGDFFWYNGEIHNNTFGDAGGGKRLMQLSSAGDLTAAHSMITPVLQITGGADVAEPFTISDVEIPQGSVVVIDEDKPGNLKLSGAAYDRRVAGIVSGANGVAPGISLKQAGVIEGGQNVALSGRVYVLADATLSAIKPGDLLTTSDIPGYAMKATDHAKAQGAVIGKAMSPLKNGKGMVLVLVSLQ